MNRWYYILNGERAGSISFDELSAKFKERKLNTEVYVWQKGMPQWAPAHLVPEFSFINDLPPPLPETQRQVNQGQLFPYGYNIDPIRFTILSVVSFGLFQYYWVYRMYAYYRDRDGISINPIFRALFSIFYMPMLMRNIRYDLHRKNVPSEPFDSVLHGFGWSIGILVATLFSFIFVESAISTVADIAGLATIYFIYIVQAIICKVNTENGYTPKVEPFSKVQIAFLALGVICWLMTISELFDY